MYQFLGEEHDCKVAYELHHKLNVGVSDNIQSSTSSSELQDSSVDSDAVLAYKLQEQLNKGDYGHLYLV